MSDHDEEAAKHRAFAGEPLEPFFEIRRKYRILNSDPRFAKVEDELATVYPDTSRRRDMVPWQALVVGTIEGRRSSQVGTEPTESPR